MQKLNHGKKIKGYTCNEDPIAQHCMRRYFVLKELLVLHQTFKAHIHVLTNLEKDRFLKNLSMNLMLLYQMVTVKSVHCKTIEHLNDQTKRRNSIGKAAVFHHH